MGVDELLAEADAIDWSSERGAYGPANDAPALLRAIATADRRRRRRALAELALHLLHLGRCAPVAARVTPFLVAFTRSPDVRGRDAILTLLGNLAAGGDPAVRDAIAAGVDVYIAALDDRAAGVRAAALYVLAHLPAAGAAAVTRMRATAGDPDPNVRACAHLALATLGVPGAPVAGEPAFVERVGAGAAAALRGQATIADTRALIEALATRERQPIPWSDGDVGGMALASLELVAVPILLEALGEIPDGDAERRLAVYDLAETLLRVAGTDPAVAAALRARTDIWRASRITRAAHNAGLITGDDA